MEEPFLNIGMKAPDFVAQTTFGPIKLSDYAGKWVVLFSHPGDFTPVCTSEFIALAKSYERFASRNAELIGLSIDSNPSHLAWVYQIYLATYVPIPFPIIADRVGDIARMYGMVAKDVSAQETVRSVFYIDPDQIIRAILTYPLTNGRSTNEMLRLLIAMQTTDEDHVLTPANWQPPLPALVPPPQTYEALLKRINDPDSLNLVCVNGFWCYKKTEIPVVPE